MSTSRHYRRQAKKLRLLNKEEFFRDVAEAASLDRDLVKLVYNSILQVLYRELRTKGAIRFPALCDFQLVFAKTRYIRGRTMSKPIIKPPHHQLRIRPVSPIRKYFRLFDEQNPGAILDPSERVRLNHFED